MPGEESERRERARALLSRRAAFPQDRARLFAFLFYLAAAIAFFGIPIAAEPGRRCLCLGASTDPGAYMWALIWWPHALLHGHNPFVSDAIFAPGGANLAHSGLIPGPALALAPVTAVFGPILAYNLMMLLAPVLAAWFAFLLCRRITGSVGAALAGGWLFGFSSYLLGQLTGHPNLALIFLLPAVVHLTLRRLDGELSARRYVVCLAAALVAQMSISTELLSTIAMFGAAALALAWLLADPGLRRRLAATIPLIVGAGVACAVISAPFLYYALQAGAKVDVVRSGLFSNDLLNFGFPTQITRLGRHQFAFVGATYRAGFVESSAYLGIPLMMIVAAQATRTWRRFSTRVLTLMMLLAALLSLGARLQVAGISTVPLPWTLVDGVSPTGLLLPARFMAYGTLAAALLCALWLVDPLRRSGLRWVGAAIAVVALLPNLGVPFWSGRQAIPAFFESAYRHHLHQGETVLILPLGIADDSMLWQARTRNWFRLAGGYIGEPVPDAYKHDPVFAGLQYGGPVPNADAAYRSFLRRHRVGAVIVDPKKPGGWPRQFARLGLRQQRVGGVLLYQVPATI